MSEKKDVEVVDGEHIALEHLKVALKPRCNLEATTKELLANSDIGWVELHIYKNFLKEAVEEEVELMFEALSDLPGLRKLTLTSKGSSSQAIPVHYMAYVLHQAEGLQELQLVHVKLRGEESEFEDLAVALSEHFSLRILQLHVENIDILQNVLLSTAHIPTLEVVDIDSARPAGEGLATALQALCTSKSLKKLTLVNVVLRFERLSSMARLLGVNQVLEELSITLAGELDLNGGNAVAQMLTTNTALKKFVMKLDKLHGITLAEEMVHALESNPTIEYFQIILDGRMSDMKVVREMQLLFRDVLTEKYKVTGQAGLTMGVICQRLGT
jgi:hypothetical protein